MAEEFEIIRANLHNDKLKHKRCAADNPYKYIHDSLDRLKPAQKPKCKYKPQWQ